MHRGNHPVQEARHTVLLGWNNHSISLLKQILLVQEERGEKVFSRPILILSERPKEEIDDELADELGAEVVGTAVVTRSGSPNKVCELL